MRNNILAYCYYHFVWATKNRQPILLPELETVIFNSILQKTMELSQFNHVYAINGTTDHIHVAVSLYPAVSISEWIKRVKGASSHAVNEAHTFEHIARFRWQRGYSVHTFGKTNLEYVVRYIQKQKQHHADNTTQPYLETLEE